MNTEEHGFEYIRVCACARMYLCLFFCARACVNHRYSKIVKRNELLSILLFSKTFIGCFGFRSNVKERWPTDKRRKESETARARKTVCNIACHAKWSEASCAFEHDSLKDPPCTIIFRGNTRYRFRSGILSLFVRAASKLNEIAFKRAV